MLYIKDLIKYGKDALENMHFYQVTAIEKLSPRLHIFLLKADHTLTEPEHKFFINQMLEDAPFMDACREYCFIFDEIGINDYYNSDPQYYSL